MIVPAVALGVAVVFGVGYVLTRAVTDIIERIKWRGSIPLYNRPEPDIDPIAVAGGLLAVAVVLFVLFATPRHMQQSIWLGLTGIGILFGILTFFLSWNDSQQSFQSHQVLQARVNRADSPAANESLYQRLLWKTHNNRDLADRLIAYERKRRPGVSEEELIKSAIERWDADNR